MGGRRRKQKSPRGRGGIDRFKNKLPRCHDSSLDMKGQSPLPFQTQKGGKGETRGIAEPKGNKSYTQILNTIQKNVHICQTHNAKKQQNWAKNKN